MAFGYQPKRSSNVLPISLTPYNKKVNSINDRVLKKELCLPSSIHKKVHNDVFTEVVPILERNVHSFNNVYY